MTEKLDRRIPLATAPNMRDLGGLPVEGGVVTPRSVFRSASLANLNDEDTHKFSELDITTVYDLRTADERQSAPDRIPAKTTSIPLDVLADSKVAAAANIGKIMGNPKAMAAALEQAGSATALLEDSYRDIIALPSALAAYRAFYQGLADGERQGSVLFHCTTGKDRTGWAAASLLMLLGADDTVVREDYLQTNTDLLPALQPFIDKIAEAGVDPSFVMPILGVQESYLDTALDEVDSRFGSLESYFTQGLGLDAGTIDAVRKRFIA